MTNENEFMNLDDYDGPAANAYRTKDGDALFELARDTGQKIIKLITDELASPDTDTYIAPDLIVGLLCLQQVTSYIQSELEIDVQTAKEAGDVEFQSIMSAIAEIPELMKQGLDAARAEAEGKIKSDIDGMLESIVKGHTIQ